MLDLVLWSFLAAMTPPVLALAWRLLAGPASPATDPRRSAVRGPWRHPVELSNSGRWPSPTASGRP